MKIRVPASTANLGPGFDTLGIALNLYNYFELTDDIGKESALADISFQKYYEFIGMQAPAKKVSIINADIPICRGLGSSSSVIVGGIVCANELENKRLSDKELLDLATLIEGHPDNVSAAIFGGLIISGINDSGVYYNKVEVSNEAKFLALIPDYQLPTVETRKVLPEHIPMKDCIENMGNVAMIISLIYQGQYDRIGEFLKDNIHEPFRKKLIKNYDLIKTVCKEEGTDGIFLSGAGPTMMALSSKDKLNVSRLKERLSPMSIEVKELEVDNTGYSVLQ
ncbi:MAG: homoserine kinase [Tissierellia bacterium]|nr:homoserine kinase [Tissierellia bacterium]